MATMTSTTQTNGRAAATEHGPPAGRSGGSKRHRQLPLVVIGVLLVIGGALAFADASLHLGSREQVLEVAQPLAAGQIVQSTDLRTVRVSTGSGLPVILASEEQSVLGRPVSVPLVAGALVTPSEIGVTAPVASGSDVVAVGLKAGQYPPDLAAGDRVQVVPVTSSSLSPESVTGDAGSGSASAERPVSATVLAIDVAAADSDNPTVFSLQVSTTSADKVAALASANQASLIQVGSGAG
jgi:SAF domain